MDEKANKPVRDYVDRETVVYEALYQAYLNEKEIYDQLRKSLDQEGRSPTRTPAAPPP